MNKRKIIKTEQININKEKIYDFDQPIIKSEEICRILESALKEKCEIVKFQDSKKVYRYKNQSGKTHYFLISSITYLGKPHKKYKKRIQLKNWYKEFLEFHKNNHDVEVHFLGLYHYENLVVFAEFKIDDYINGKLNSSSAHICINDIYQSLLYGVFYKTDERNNHIIVITSDKFKNYIDNKDNVEKNELFLILDKFNKDFFTNEWINAIDAINEMKNNQFRDWKQAEWVGFFLEFKFSQFLTKNNLTKTVKYIAKNKKDNKFVFDLYLQNFDCYADLKASDIKQKEALGNDQKQILEAIKEKDKLIYFVFEHETKKDIDFNNEMAIARTKLIEEKSDISKISYKQRMKHSVLFKKMSVFEINKINMDEILKPFNQGVQQDGSLRNPKFSIKKLDDNYVLYRFLNKEQ